MHRFTRQLLAAGRLSFCVLALAMLLPAFADPAPAQMKLFLLIGQSNMAGRGKVEPQDQVVNPHIFMLTKDLKWVPATDPLHFDKPGAASRDCLEFRSRSSNNTKKPQAWRWAGCWESVHWRSQG